MYFIFVGLIFFHYLFSCLFWVRIVYLKILQFFKRVCEVWHKLLRGPIVLINRWTVSQTGEISIFIRIIFWFVFLIDIWNILIIYTLLRTLIVIKYILTSLHLSSTSSAFIRLFGNFWCPMQLNVFFACFLEDIELLSNVFPAESYAAPTDTKQSL